MMENKIALVTGGSRGLGRDMALSLARGGSDVILTFQSRNKEAGDVVNEIQLMGRKALALQLDLSDIKSLDVFVAQLVNALDTHWGRDKFDFLINNAGIGATIPIAQVTEEAFNHLLNIRCKFWQVSGMKVG